MLTFLYNLETGEYMGTTIRPEIYECGKTTIEPIEYDKFTEQLYFTDDAWEIRTI